MIWSAAETLSSLQMHSPAAHMSLLALLSKHNGRTVEKEPKLHHFSSPHSQISEKQACLRNSACVWLWCFTFYHSLFSESTVVEKLNRAQNSDSKTHAEKSNPTSRTDFRSKTLTDIFFGSPCRYHCQGWAGIPVSRDSRQYKPQISLSFPSLPMAF